MQARVQALVAAILGSVEPPAWVEPDEVVEEGTWLEWTERRVAAWQGVS